MILSLKYLLLCILWIINTDFKNTPYALVQDNNDVIVDCNYTFEKATSGIEIPKSIIKQLTLVDVEYYSFDKNFIEGK